MVFPDVRAACKAAAVLRNETTVDAVEMFDRASLRECAKEEAMLALVPDINGERGLSHTLCSWPSRHRAGPRPAT